MKQTKFLRFLSLALALLLTAAAVPAGALAASEPIHELVATDITLDQTHFAYTGEEIRPNVTVRVKGQLLTLDRDYTLEYRDNVEVGTAAVVVTGIATSGYTGSVTIHFTIQEAPQDPTQPEESKPQETEPEETEPVEYKITKGNGAAWHKGSDKDLTFVTDGNRKDLQKVLIEGKTVNSKYYTVVGDPAEVTLDRKLLQNLKEGKHTIVLEFADGKAEGFFHIAPPADDSNPKTGDSYGLHAWTALLFVSLTGIIGTAFALRKKLWQ